MSREPPLGWAQGSTRTEPTDGETAGTARDGDGEPVAAVAPQGLVDVLSSERRRRTLHVLRRRGSPVALDDLAEAVAELETDDDRVACATVQKVSISLHHVHLPKLDEAGLLDYDPGRNLIEQV